MDLVTGRVYVLKDRRVRVVTRGDWRRRAPRNVLVEDVETGERFVRPFRGLRRPRESEA